MIKSVSCAEFKNDLECPVECPRGYQLIAPKIITELRKIGENRIEDHFSICSEYECTTMDICAGRRPLRETCNMF